MVPRHHCDEQDEAAAAVTKLWPRPATAEEKDGEGAEASTDDEKDRDAETKRDPALTQLLLHHSMIPELTDCVKYFVLGGHILCFGRQTHIYFSYQIFV